MNKTCFVVFHIGRVATKIDVKTFKGAKVIDLIKAMQRVSERLNIKCWVSGVVK